AWVGDGTNVLDSLADLASLFGAEVVAACPEGYEPVSDCLSLVRDPREAARGADVLVTDIWVSLGQEAERTKRVRDLEPYRLDETYYLQRFLPRRARSKWSRINREAATRLIEAGLMRPPGLAEVERAKADGRWEAAYDSPRNAVVPEDLERALARNKKAREFFATLDSQNRYAILYRIQDAKRPETRARRITQFVELLARGEKPHRD